jgi:hypothetical protein
MIAGVALFLPLIDRTPDDFRLTGQDFELDLLNVLSLVGILFLLIVRFILALFDFQIGSRIFSRLQANSMLVGREALFMVLFLPPKLSSPSNPLPLLI